MTINEEVDQIIIRTVIKNGMNAVPKDLSFINRYGIKELYFIGVDNKLSNKKTTFVDIGLKELLSEYHQDTTFPLLGNLYLSQGKKGVMKHLKEENYFRTFIKIIKYGK